MKQNEFQKSSKIFKCESCDYETCRNSQYKRHIMTSKHKNETNETKMKQQSSSNTYECMCGMVFGSRTTLWRHKNKCDINKESADNQITEIKNNCELVNTNTDLITYLMNENKELKNMIMDVCKNNNNTVNSNNITHTNSHNKTFNMNVFLNEHCKDAMNISEFVDSIQLGFNDLVNVGKVGYVEGISSIIINKLRSLDIHKRPMHCGDEKRHSMYIKEDGKWEKQPEDNNRVRRLIKQVAFKNTKNTVLFKEKYPDCGTSASKYSDQYNKIVMESFGGRGASDEEKENKIVRMIAKEVYIDKTI
jgi:hypothetical protein